MSMSAEEIAVSKELKRRLGDPKINLSELARLSGVDVRTLRHIRHTKRLPRTLLVAQVGPWLEEARNGG